MSKWWQKRAAALAAKKNTTAAERKREAQLRAAALARSHLMANAGLGDLTSPTVGTKVLIDEINTAYLEDVKKIMGDE